MMLDSASTRAWENGGNNGLDEILARAFAVTGGYERLNYILKKVDYDLFIEAGHQNSGMLVVVDIMRRDIAAKGSSEEALVELYKYLAGDAELRNWMERHVPEKVDVVPLATFEAARYSHHEEQWQRRIDSIDRALTVYATQLRRGALSRKSAEQLIQLLFDVQSSKNIHDHLHKLLNEVLSELGRVAKNKDENYRKTSVQIQIIALNTTKMKIAGEFCHDHASAEGRQRRDYLLSQMDVLIKLIEGKDFSLRETATMGRHLLRQLLRQQMPLFDNQIVNHSERIPLAEFADIIETMQVAKLDQQDNVKDPVLPDNLVQNIRSIDYRLKQRCSIHRAWQQIDMTIMIVEDRLGIGREDPKISDDHLQEIEFHCSNISKLLSDLKMHPIECEQLGYEIVVQRHSKIRTAPDRDSIGVFIQQFRDFCQAARGQFGAADEVLVEDCRSLVKLKEPLALIA